MNSFIRSSRYQLIYLEGHEVRRSNCSIAMGYWYKNDNSDSLEEFMPPKLLEDAFYRALQDFPILAGHLKTDKHSRMYIEVDEYNLNMPVYTDTTCDLKYSDIEKAGFNLLNLPIDLYGTYGVPVPSKLFGGKIKPTNIRILRFKNNSGVLVYSSIIHCVMDGYGYVHFMNRWAEVARWMQQQQQSEAGSEIQLQEHEYAHNRAIPNGLRSDEITPSTWETVGSIICCSNVVSRWIAKLSPEKRGWLFKKWKEEKNHTYCFFHIPSKTIQDLRSSVQKHAPPDVKYSINDILTTCLAIAVVEAKQKAKADKKRQIK